MYSFSVYITATVVYCWNSKCDMHLQESFIVHRFIFKTFIFSSIINLVADVKNNFSILRCHTLFISGSISSTHAVCVVMSSILVYRKSSFSYRNLAMPSVRCQAQILTDWDTEAIEFGPIEFMLKCLLPSSAENICCILIYDFGNVSSFCFLDIGQTFRPCYV